LEGERKERNKEEEGKERKAGQVVWYSHLFQKGKEFGKRGQSLPGPSLFPVGRFRNWNVRF